MRTRKEQIEEMVQVNSAYLCHEDYTPDNLRMMLAAAISEAEERARAECAADTRRLEWLEKTRSVVLEDADNGWRVMIGGVEFSLREETARNAIDAAREVG